MKKRIAIVGSGAVGGYLGGHLARTGNDVTLIDPWPEHIEAIRAHGLKLSGMTDEETYTVQVPTMHLTEVQSLSKQQPIDIAIVSSKSYDTEWSATLIRPRQMGSLSRRRIPSTRKRSRASLDGAAQSAALSATILASISTSRAAFAAPCHAISRPSPSMLVKPMDE
jgi:glycine/D-amino acid oxidase-like deaminating enzyme